MGKVRRWGDPLDGPVGMRWRKENVRNLTDDQQYILDMLFSLPANLGGKQEEWLPTPPFARPDGQISPDLVDAIFDFQHFWVSQGKLKAKYADGVFDRHGPSLRLMEMASLGLAFAADPLKVVPPEGQFDATACWAASYAWWLRASPGQTPVAQSAIIVAGSTSGGMVDSDGTVNIEGFMRFLSGRHAGLKTSRINPADFKDFLSTSKLPAEPIIIAFASSLMGGHANVIHAYDAEKDTVSVMECWYPDPSVDPNYVFSNDQGFPAFFNKNGGAPFRFQGAHLTRSSNHYASRPHRGKLLLFPDHS
jgi:hypothetical protein